MSCLFHCADSGYLSCAARSLAFQRPFRRRQMMANCLSRLPLISLFQRCENFFVLLKDMLATPVRTERFPADQFHKIADVGQDFPDLSEAGEGRHAEVELAVDQNEIVPSGLAAR